MEKSTVKQSFYLGIDVGATKVRIGAFLSGGRMLASETYPTLRSSCNEALACLMYATEHFLTAHGDLGKLLIIGIGIRGYVDSTRGIWVHSMLIPDFQPVELANLFCQRFHVPTVIDNDVHAATLAELHFGFGRTYRDFIYVNIGSGVAAGLVCDGKLIRGANNFAGEFGHHLVNHREGENISVYEGCVQDLISGLGVVAQAKRLLPRYPSSVLSLSPAFDAEDVLTAFEHKDPLAKEVIRRGTEAMGIALFNLIGLFNPSAVIFGGGIARRDSFFDGLRAFMDENRPAGPSMELKEFARSACGAEEVGVRGAACVAMDWHYRQ